MYDNSNPFAEERRILSKKKKLLKSKLLVSKCLAILTLIATLTSIYFLVSKYQKITEYDSFISANESAMAIVDNAKFRATNILKVANKESIKIISDAKEKAADLAKAKEEKVSRKATAKKANAKKTKKASYDSFLSFPIKLDSAELNLLYRLVYSESGNQPIIARQGVCWAVLNRVKKNGASITNIIYAPGQFDVVRNGTIKCIPSSSTKDAVDDVLAGKVADPTYGASFFCVPKYSSSKALAWFNTLTPTVILGIIHFYK